MDTQSFDRRIDDVKSKARGRWTGLLRQLGVEEKILNGRNQPCPICGGEDRFQYTDKFADGNYVCRGCGAGDGFKLAQATLNIKFWEVFTQVEALLGATRNAAAPERREPSSEFMKRLARTTWEEAKPIVAGDEVDRYLRARGLDLEQYPRVLRCHPALGYFIKRERQRKAELVGTYPAMVAPLQGEDGRAVTVHRTYVQGGRKAPVAEPKKVLHSFSGGPSIRLFEANEELALAEGIETALAVHLSTGKPVWAVYSASNMERVWIPATVRRVFIYADNDASYTGQAAAYVLAKRLKGGEKTAGPRDVSVFVPRQTGTDWADVWFSRGHCKKAA
jgi:putative DNA primase/helicase